MRRGLRAPTGVSVGLMIRLAIATVQWHSFNAHTSSDQCLVGGFEEEPANAALTVL